MMSKIKTLTTIIFMSVLLIATSCTPTNQEPPSSPTSPAPFQEQSICVSVNCWVGIIPGTATLTEAQDLLEAQYGERNFTMGEQFFSWRTNSIGVSSGGQVIATASGRVNIIVVNLLEHQLTIAELIDWIGDPSFVYLDRTTSHEVLCTSLLLSYPNKGINVSLYTDSGSSIEINPAQSVDSLIFLTSEVAANSTYTDHYVLEWQGYADYCDLASLTATP
jgi:hypothetical protein